MKITGVKEIYMIPSERTDKPGVTTIVLENTDTVVLDGSVANYLNVDWDEVSKQVVVKVDMMEKSL